MSIRKIILVQHTHTDIGYTGLRSDVAILHIHYIRSILEHCRRDARFRWTVEAGWPLEQFMAVASKAERKELAERIASGQIEMTGFYAQPLTQLCNLEELYASLELSFQLFEKSGVRIETAMLNDIGGLSYNMPQAASYYGIRNFVNGCGGFNVMLPFSDLPHLFYLSGPDDSRLLFYHVGDDAGGRRPELIMAQYSFGQLFFLDPLLREIDGCPPPACSDEKSVLNFHGRDGIDAFLERLDRQGYPYDTLLMQTGLDNRGPVDRLLEVVDYWNSTHRQPEVVLGTCKEFFDNIVQRYGKSIPVIRGEISCSWTEQAITNAYATGRYRRAGRLLKTWASLEACCGRPDVELWWRIMKNLEFYNDHTYGLRMWNWQEKLADAGSFLHERFNLPRDSWEIKSRYSNEALADVENVLERCTVRLANDVPDYTETISVLNLHSFPADGRVEFRTWLPGVELLSEDGSVLPSETVNVNSQWRIHKADVGIIPAYGLKVFRVCKTDKEPESRYFCNDWSLCGPAVAVHISPQTGAVQKWTTANRDYNWIDDDKGHLNELHYFDVDGVGCKPIMGGLDDDVTFYRLPLVSVRKISGHSGAHSAGMIVERLLRQDGRDIIVETSYMLDAGGLRIRNQIRKIHTFEKEACFFAFPFRLNREFRFDVEQQGQITRFPEERLEGASNHNFGMQDFISASDNSSQIVLTSFQACLVALGKPSYYHFGLHYQPIEQPTVYSYAFNNHWNTNCPLYQQNDLTFDYHVAAFNHPYDPVKAYHISRHATQPPLVFPGDLRTQGLHNDTTNLITLSTDGVLVESIRPENQDVWALRIIEITGKTRQCDMKITVDRFSHYAIPKNYADAPQWKATGDEPLSMQFRPAECKTVLLKKAKQ